MSLLMFANNMAFWILKYRGELTNYEDFKKRAKFKLTNSWNEELFNEMLEKGKDDEINPIREWVKNSMDKDGVDESYYINN